MNGKIFCIYNTWSKTLQKIHESYRKKHQQYKCRQFQLYTFNCLHFTKILYQNSESWSLWLLLNFGIFQITLRRFGDAPNSVQRVHLFLLVDGPYVSIDMTARMGRLVAIRTLESRTFPASVSHMIREAAFPLEEAITLATFMHQGCHTQFHIHLRHQFHHFANWKISKQKVRGHWYAKIAALDIFGCPAVRTLDHYTGSKAKFWCFYKNYM